MFNNELWQKPAGGAGGGDFYSHQIANSLRNSAAQNGNLTFTAGTPTSSTTFTMSYWVKRYNTSGDGSDNLVFATGTGGGTYLFWGFSTTDFNFQPAGGNWSGTQMNSNNMYRDTSAYYHHVLTFDSTNATQADRLKVYVNGERITSWSTEDVTAGIGASEDFSFINQSGVVQAFGGLSGTGHGTVGTDLQMAEIVFNDGQAYGPDSYGETKNGVWIPKDPSGLTFGNNGYWLKMASGAIGTDSSGNGNNFTVTNIEPHDVMLDSPTFNSSSNGGNFATIGPLWKTSDMTFSEGNLKWTCSTNERGLMSNWAVPIGTKAYWEYKPVSWGGNTSNGDEMWIGINQGIAALVGGDRGGKTTGYAYGTSNGYKTILASASSYGATIRSGDIVGVAVDRVNHTINFSKNGSWQGTFAISSTMDLFPFIGSGGGTSSASGIFNFGADGTFAGTVTAQGNSDDTGYGNFYYDPPTGFLAMCAGNLPLADAINPAETSDDYPQKLFTSLAYTGGTTGHVTGFKPDWVWVKARNTGQSNGLWDSTRGTTNILLSNEQNAESTSSGLTAFNTDGYDMGTYYNQGANTYASWSWRANGGTTASNGTGDITSTVQADPSGCFSIVTYTGSGTAGDTIGHGLSTTPDMIMIKNRSSVDSWAVYSSVLGNTIHLVLDTTSAQVTSSAYWNSTSPTSSVFTVGTGDALNQNTKNYVAYCFANCEGYIKAGSYVGNGNVDNAFVYTGFRPAFVLTKGIRLGDGWNIHDNATSPFNVADTVLQPNTASAELSNYDIDMLSNGFKVRGVGGDLGSSGVTYIYLAFAKNPFKYATAR